MEKDKSKIKTTDVEADQNCMSKCVEAFITLSRQHCDSPSCSDSVAEARAERSRLRVLQWLAAFIQDHKFL